MNTQNTPSSAPIIYDGKLGEQYKIFIVNLLLGIITLGIYHFWGKTRQRRYTTSSFSINQDRLEYTGTGGELFWGMVKALFVVAILSIPLFYAFAQLSAIEHKYPQLADTETTPATSAPTGSSTEDVNKAQLKHNKFKLLETLPPEVQEEYKLYTSIVGVYLIFFYTFLPFVCVYGSLRYRITHTTWRGIRGHMVGSSIIYGFVGLLHLILKIITLGLWIPFADGMTYKYKMNRITFGNQQAVFTPAYGKLFGTHLITFLLGILGGAALGGILYAIIPAPIVVASSTTAVANAHETVSSIIFFAILAGLLVFVIARFWYRAAFARMRYNNLTIGGVGFNCQITGAALLGLSFGNLLIFIFTLGLGSPIILQRKMRFFCNNTTLVGNISNSPILQAVGKPDTAAEGFSSLFDINISLF